jgi:ABC-type transport system involved in multi-copper enzyme maturation permease subunit
MSAMAAGRTALGRLGAVGGSFRGITAIGTKELRGRMRGRRAFAFLTFYLAVLSGFAWMIEGLAAQSNQGGGFGFATSASAQIGTAIFTGLLVLETLLVLFLAPAFTAGTISQEREKQTLDLLVTTPISSFAIVFGKLFSAHAWVFILVIASIPLTAIVFVFGGVAPEDVLRGYAVLLIEAIGFGAIGLFCSALLRRTLAATIASYFIVLALTVGATFVWYFLYSTGSQPVQLADGTFSQKAPPPEGILWFNPFVADADVLCPTGTGFNGLCSVVGTVTGHPVGFGNQFSGGGPVPGPAMQKVVNPDGSVTIIGNVGGGVGPVPQIAPAPGGPVLVPSDSNAFVGPDVTLEAQRDLFWPRSAAALLVLSAVLILASVQLVAPTRRWHPLERFRRRRSKDRA